MCDAADGNGAGGQEIALWIVHGSRAVILLLRQAKVKIEVGRRHIRLIDRPLSVVVLLKVVVARIRAELRAERRTDIAVLHIFLACVRICSKGRIRAVVPVVTVDIRGREGRNAPVDHTDAIVQERASRRGIDACRDMRIIRRRRIVGLFSTIKRDIQETLLDRIVSRGQAARRNGIPEHIHQTVVRGICPGKLRIVDHGLARARILIGIFCRRCVLHIIARNQAAILQLNDAVPVRDLRPMTFGHSLGMRRIIDVGRPVIRLDELTKSGDTDILRCNLTDVILGKVGNVEVIARVLQPIGDSLARTRILIVIVRSIRVNGKIVLDIDRLRADLNCRAREIVPERISGALPVVLDRTRAIIDFPGTRRVKYRIDIPRRDRQRIDAALPSGSGIVLGAAVHAIVRGSRIARRKIRESGIQPRVADRLIHYVAVRIAADRRVCISCGVEIFPVDQRERCRIKSKRIPRRNTAEDNIARRQPGHCRRAVVIFFLARDIDRERLLVDICRKCRRRGPNRVVGGCRSGPREGQRVGDRTSCRRRSTCLRIRLCLCRGVFAVIRPRHIQYDPLVAVCGNNSLQMLTRHRIDKVAVRLIERRRTVVLLDEMLRKQCRKVTSGDGVARVMDVLVARSREIEIRRVDGHVVVNAVRKRHVRIVVLRTVQADIVKVDRHRIPAAKIQGTGLEMLLDMSHILVGLAGYRVCPYDISCAVVHLRSGVDTEAEVVRGDRTLADCPLAVGGICHFIVARIRLSREGIGEIRVLHILAVRDDVSVCIRHNVGILHERSVGIARTVETLNTRRIERRARDAVRRKRCRTASVAVARRHGGNVLRIVDCGRIIRLRHIGKPECDLARGDRTRRVHIETVLGVGRRHAVGELIVAPAVRGIDLDIVGNILRCHIAAAVAHDVLVRRTVREIIDVVRRDRHLCAVVHRRAVRRPHELVVVGRPRRIDDIAARVVIDKFIIVTRCRIDELRVPVIDLVDARILCKPHIQHTAVNRALCILGKVVRSIDRDIIVVQMELVRHRIGRAVRRIGAGVTRSPKIHHNVAAEINPVSVQHDTDGCDVVLHIIRCRRSVVLHGTRAVVDLRGIPRRKGHIACIDDCLADRALAVAVRIKDVVRRITAEGCPHRCSEACVLYILVRARICIGGKRAARPPSIVADDAAQIGQLVRAVDESRAVAVQHCCIGSRNRRINRRIRRCSVKALADIAEGDVHPACRDRIVRCCNRCCDGCPHRVDEAVVPGIHRIDLHIVGDGLAARANILIIIGSRRLIRRTVPCDESREGNHVVRRAYRPERVARRTDHIGRSIIDLRHRSLNRRLDILRRDGAVAQCVKCRCAGSKRKVPARSRIAHVIGHAADRCTTCHILRIIFRRLQADIAQDTQRVSAHRHLRIGNVVLYIIDGRRPVRPLDRPRAVIDLRRRSRCQERHRRGVQLERRDFAQPLCRRTDGIVIRIRTAEREP